MANQKRDCIRERGKEVKTNGLTPLDLFIIFRMTRKNIKEYHRWGDYEDEETEMGVNQEEENLDDNEEMIISTNSMTTFVQPSSNSNNGNGSIFEGLSHHHSFFQQASPRRTLREKVRESSKETDEGLC